VHGAAVVGVGVTSTGPRGMLGVLQGATLQQIGALTPLRHAGSPKNFYEVGQGASRPATRERGGDRGVTPAYTALLVQVLIGICTVAAAFYAAKVGAAGTTQRENAAAREEWFRRLQWAAELALAEDNRSSAAGLAALKVLGDSPLAADADLRLLEALNLNDALDALDATYTDVDDIEFVVDDEA
jgi:hypothetical protein